MTNLKYLKPILNIHEQLISVPRMNIYRYPRQNYDFQFEVN